jgi:hypothetical protein
MLGSKVEQQQQHHSRDEYDQDDDDVGLNRPSDRSGIKRGESFSEAESESESKSRSRVAGYWAQDTGNKFSVHHGASDGLGSRGGVHVCMQIHALASIHFVPVCMPKGQMHGTRVLMFKDVLHE